MKQQTTRKEPALATQGERHAKCGKMVAYGELHWTDECKAKTP